MKRNMIACLIAICATLAWADGETIELAVGGIWMGEAQFPIQTVNVANKKVADAVVQNDQRQVQVIGKAVGSTEVLVTGNNGRNWQFKVTVTDKQEETLNALKRDLEDAIPELDVSIGSGALRISGKIKSIAKLKLKNRILSAYKGVAVRDLSTFQASDEVMLRLEKSFENADFKVVENQPSPDSGTISIIQDKDADIIRIKGKVYSDEQKKRVKEILDAEPWLKDSQANAAKDGNGVDEYKVPYQMDVDVENITLQVDVLHIGLTKSDCKNIGIDWESLLTGQVDLAASVAKEIVKSNTTTPGTQRTTTKGMTADVLNISAVLGLMARNNVSHVRRSGYLTLKSNGSEKPSRLHIGSTVWVQAPSTTNNNNVSELKEIEYGMILEAKGGMTHAGLVKLDLKQEVSYPVNTVAGGSVAYELKKNNTMTPIECALGEAVAISGVRETAISNNTSGSIPYLRNVPVLRWLVAQDRDEFTDMQILTLISVRKMEASLSKIDPIDEQLQKMKLEDDEIFKEKDETPVPEPPRRKWYQFWKF